MAISAPLIFHRTLWHVARGMQLEPCIGTPILQLLVTSSNDVLTEDRRLSHHHQL